LAPRAYALKRVRQSWLADSFRVADRIPDADVVEREPDNRDNFVAIETFLTRAHEEHLRRAAEPARVLATVLFTDLVESTAKATELGPRWQEVLREHNLRIRRTLARYNGREIDTTGDGFFASGFDGPARAIRCACAIRAEVTALGLGIRVGVHTGECDVVDEKLSGLAVASARGSPERQKAARSSSRAPCVNSSQDQASSSVHGANESSKESSRGRSTPSLRVDGQDASATF
jgi:hypothetical protein